MILRKEHFLSEWDLPPGFRSSQPYQNGAGGNGRNAPSTEADFCRRAEQFISWSCLDPTRLRRLSARQNPSLERCVVLCSVWVTETTALLYRVPHPLTFKTVRALQVSATEEAFPENIGLSDRVDKSEWTLWVWEFRSPILLRCDPSLLWKHTTVNLGCVGEGVPPAFWTDQHQLKWWDFLLFYTIWCRWMIPKIEEARLYRCVCMCVCIYIYIYKNITPQFSPKCFENWNNYTIHNFN